MAMAQGADLGNMEGLVGADRARIPGDTIDGKPRNLQSVRWSAPATQHHREPGNKDSSTGL